MAERLRRPRRHGHALQPDAGPCDRARRAHRREASAATPAEAAARADVVISMVADDDAVAALYGGPDGVARRPPPGLGRRRHEHGPARRRSRRSAAGVRAPRRGHPRRARCRAASRPTAVRRADDHGRRRGGRPRARPSGLRAAGQADLPHRAARDRRGDEARGQHGHLRAQRRASRRRSSSPSGPGSTRALAYEVLAASAVGAPFVGYKRDGLRRARDDAGGVLAGARGEGPAPHRGLADGHLARRCPRPRRTSN